jgi:hypothetical protein
VTIAELFVQPVVDPPTEAVTVTFTVPGVTQVNVGSADVLLSNVPVPVPPVVAQVKLGALPPPVVPTAESRIVPGTVTSDGLAESAVTAAHVGAMVVVPLMMTEPLLPASTAPPLQTRFTFAVVAMLAMTVNGAEPTHFSMLGASVVPVSAIV